MPREMQHDKGSRYCYSERTSPPSVLSTSSPWKYASPVRPRCMVKSASTSGAAHIQQDVSALPERSCFAHIYSLEAMFSPGCHMHAAKRTVDNDFDCSVGGAGPSILAKAHCTPNENEVSIKERMLLCDDDIVVKLRPSTHHRMGWS